MDQEIRMHTPVILKEGSFKTADLDRLKAGHIWRTTDIYERQSQDLFEIQHPALANDPSFREQSRAFVSERIKHQGGDWIYFPWNGVLLHCLGEEEQFLLRTNRNRELVSADEQAKLQGSRVSIAGLSVGGGIAVGLAYSGIANNLHLADHDVLETPNLNRIRAGLKDVGTPKAELTAQQIWDVNPYAKLDLYATGIDQSNVDEFLGGSHPVNVAFDEIDDFRMKVILRHEARRKRIPVVMLTGLGDSVLIDIERYDLNPHLPLFSGLIGDLENKILNNEVTPDDARRYAAQIVGIQNVPTRAVQSLLEMGKSLVGRPQLGSTVTLESGIGSYIVRKIILGTKLESGRYKVSLDQVAELENETANTPERERFLKKLLG